jgi:hypothetical protein
MLFWMLLGVLLLFAAVGSVYFVAERRAKNPRNYARYIYACMGLFSFLPVATGDWPWALVFLPVSLFVGRMIIARKRG